MINQYTQITNHSNKQISLTNYNSTTYDVYFNQKSFNSLSKKKNDFNNKTQLVIQALKPAC